MVYPSHDLTGPIGRDAVLLKPIHEALVAKVCYVQSGRHGAKGPLFRNGRKKYFLDI